MNWFKRAAKEVAHGTAVVVTAPVKVVRNTVRVIQARDAAVTVFEILDEAADNPKLYRDPSWWRRLFVAGGRLVAVIPIAPEVRIVMQNNTLKLAAIGSLVVTIFSQLDPAVVQQILSFVPEKYRPIALSIVAMITAGAAFAHPAPSQNKDSK